MKGESIGISAPQDWNMKPLAEVTTIISRGTAPAYVKASSILAVGQRCVREQGFDASAARPHNPALMRRVLHPRRGDVLLNSTGTGTIGRSCLFDVDGDSFIVDSHVTVIRSRPGFAEGRWIQAVVSSPWGLRHLEKNCYTGSTNQVELVSGRLAQTIVPVPSIAEQRRIAEILDALDEQIVAVRRVLAKKSQVETALAARVWRDPSSAWTMLPLGDVASVAAGLTLGSEPSGPNSIELPYLRVANVQDGFIDTGEMKTVRVFRSEIERCAVQPGDVLLTEGGDFDKLGRGAVWDGNISPCLHQNHIFRVRCRRNKMLPDYLAGYMSSPIGRRYFLNIAKQTTNLASINSTQLKAMPVSVPSVEEQLRLLAPILTARSERAHEEAELDKLQLLNKGLMEDLLTGKVRVTRSGELTG